MARFIFLLLVMSSWLVFFTGCENQKPCGRLAFHVVDSETKKPIAGAKFSISVYRPYIYTHEWMVGRAEYPDLFTDAQGNVVIVAKEKMRFGLDAAGYLSQSLTPCDHPPMAYAGHLLDTAAQTASTHDYQLVTEGGIITIWMQRDPRLRAR